MGILGRLFGGGPRRPPPWARDFGGDAARFDAFVAAVVKLLSDEGFPIDGGDVRSGSVMIESDDGGGRDEWILHEVAARCAKADPATWPALLRADFAGEPEPAPQPAPAPKPKGPNRPRRAARAPAAPTSNRAWVIGTAAWGGVLLECGAAETMLIALPIRDRAPLAALPAFPRGAVHAVVVCNAGAEGHLAATAIARATGVDRVYAIDPARPVDRGDHGGGDDGGGPDPTGVRVERFPKKLRRGPLCLTARGASVLATWDNGVTALVGDAVPFTLIGELCPRHVVGLLSTEGGAGDLLDWLMQQGQVVLMANVPGLDARRLAEALSQLGLGSQVVNLPPDDEKPPAGAPEPAPGARRLQVLASMIAGDFAAADALAAAAIADGDADADDLRYQRAMIALMRGDEEAALPLLEADPDSPQSMNSRAVIYARRGDGRARDLARAALARLPGDVIAIRGAILIEANAGDRDAARALLAEQGHHLDAELRARLERTIDEPGGLVAHRFPGHAQLVVDAVKPMVDGGRFADAEPLLRRAAAWDPENIGITAELGFTLSQQQRDDDAVALYDEAIGRGGSAILLRMNRGNCHLRRGRFTDAAADLRACVELKPDWHEARVNLVSALFAAGDAAGARGQLAALRAHGGPPQHIRALEQMLAGRL